MKYKIDYFGYIYEWTNIKNGKKYIGSHYGSVDDYYKGSGKSFKPAYARHPENFIMNVLEYILIDDKKLVLIAEQRWLDSIDNIRENKNYYNLNNYSLGGSSHLTSVHIKKRASTLKNKHLMYGLSDAERNSYKNKIESRLNRISKSGFSVKELDQHSRYGFKVQVISPIGDVTIYNSCSKATKELGIDVQYGLKVCLTKETFKGFKIKKIRDPITDCRGNK